ncbi:MAG: HEPN domain-containing protein [Nodularia sp. (in: Bacteria)]|nr:MAG: HEPN domain-containing protein [Nodularia sp. (in: cyanobacteria)]
MKFDWLSYLEVAQILLQEVNNSRNQGNNLSINEAMIRSSISRAYYSVFCLTRNYLRDTEGCSELRSLKLDVHKYIIDNLIKSKKIEFRNLGNDLRSLRLLRNKVDYEDEIPFHSLNAYAKTALKLANSIIKILDKISQD